MTLLLLLSSAAASEGGTATPDGVECTAAVGSAVASGGARSMPAGDEALAAVGSSSATGGAIAFPAGVQAVASVGTIGNPEVQQPAASSGGGGSFSGRASHNPWRGFYEPRERRPESIAGVAQPRGVYAAAAVGTPRVSAGARIVPRGAAVRSMLGTVRAFGIQNPTEEELVLALLEAVA